MGEQPRAGADVLLLLLLRQQRRSLCPKLKHLHPKTEN
jgi:hypothetical protein